MLLAAVGQLDPWGTFDRRVSDGTAVGPPAAEFGRIDLLTPRGQVDAAPTAARWLTTRPGARVRLRVRNSAGAVLFERIADDPRSRSVRFTAEERGRWRAALTEADEATTVELDLVAADGELVATSEPVEVRRSRAFRT